MVPFPQSIVPINCMRGIITVPVDVSDISNIAGGVDMELVDKPEKKR